MLYVCVTFIPRRRRTRLRILECVAGTEGKPEGELISKLMRILEIRSKLKRIYGKKPLLEELENAEEPYIHISAHGDYSRRIGTYINTPRGRVSNGDIEECDIQGELIVLTACKVGHADMARAFWDAGCKYFIAPLHDLYWQDSAVFSVMFYRRLLGEGMTPWIAFKSATTFPNIEGCISFYEKGEKVFLEE